MKLQDLLRHIADNVENGKDWSDGIDINDEAAWAVSVFFGEADSIKLKPRTHVVNGFTVPAPMDMPCNLNIGDEFIFIHPIRGTTKWIYSEASKSIVIDGFNRGVFFKSTNEAELNRLAQQGIDPDKD